MAKKKAYTAEKVEDLWEGSSLELLKELHILTREGKLNADTRRKLKQVYHLFNLLKPALDELFASEAAPHLVDLGAGKSYLGFILYDLYFAKEKKGQLTGVEWRAELVQKSREIAQCLDFGRMNFAAGAIADYAATEPVHMVTALHACDTATDEAIHFALRYNARYIALVPCCQAELARVLESVKTPALGQMWRHSLHRRDFGSQLTNVIRTLYLEAHGYKVRVTELIGWEHSLKNEFILAEKVQAQNSRARNDLDELLQALQLPRPLPMKLFSQA